MKRKKHKHVRRTVRFYRMNHGFRPPYKVLVDGNFVHALQELKLGDAQELLCKLLGDPVRVFTTPCVQVELRGLGREYEGTRQACRRCALHKCGHDAAAAGGGADGEEGGGPTSAAECLLSQVGGGNPDHFLVATQDKALQRRVGALPGGAVLYASVNGVQMEPPSARQQAAVRAAGEAAMGATAGERHAAALRAGGGGDGARPEGGQQQQQQQQQDKPVFRRKKAKGPNPLAMRPKQKRPAPAGSAGKQSTDAGDPAAASDRKKRQRRRGRGGGGEQGSGGGGGSD